MKPILVTRFSEKDPKKRIRHKVSQEISRNIETGIQNGQLSHVATTVASSTSVKSKRSSGLLSAIVRRTRIKKIKHMGTTPQTVSCTLKNSTFVPSNTSLETHTEEEVEINVENYDKKILQEPNVLGIVNKDTTNTTDSNHSILSVETTRRQFFRKFCKKKVSSGENRKKKSEQTLAVQTSKEDILGPKMSCKICQSDSCRDVSRMDRNTSSGFIYAPTSFINCRKSTLSATILSALQSVQMLSTHFQESENHLVKILTKYVSNSSFQKELLDALSQHSKLQWEAERRTSALANDMWMRQIEIGKAQEQTLQETLNSLVKQNRQLQLDNETMLHKHEKLAKKLRSSSEVGSKCRCPGKQFFPRYYRLQVNPATPRERRVQAHLELPELVEDPRKLTCYAEIRHAIGFLLPRNRD
ncbi:hypothetical protein NQ317_011750 [Molorchus minor]|uniref:Uncharacterized protein n=1 Tax=Molorchus minor TaxID=1323400 RepID=A0ABQ9JT99_9CUCU|nr:hypothetical protein NQ317_011750 [Molorchus minor]